MDDLTRLLKFIHQDNGGHTMKVGVQRSVDDAIEKYKLVVGHSEALAIARNDLARLKITERELRDEIEDMIATATSTYTLLTEIANAIHGGERPGTRWGFQALPEYAINLRKELDDLRALIITGARIER